MAPDNLNLIDCSPSSLSSWLLENRFQNDQTKTATFLLESIAGLPEAEQISEQLVAAVSTDDATGAEADATITNSLLNEPVLISCTTPRCKFQVSFTARGIVFEEASRTSTGSADTKQPPPKNRFVVESVEHLIAFPKPRDCQPQKKIPSDMLLLVLPNDSGVLYKQKALLQICFQLPDGAPTLKEMTNGDDDNDEDALDMDGLDATDQWMRVCSQALGGLNPRLMIRVVNPALPKEASDNHFWRFQFRSHQDENVSTTTGDLPFVPCYMGVKDGSLYPLQEGLLFFAPPLFLPRARLQSIDCGRAGNNSSRYVDLKVLTEDGESIEFTNIHRTETKVLNDYIHKTLIPAMQKDLDGAEELTEHAAVAEQMRDDDNELNASMDTHPPTSRKTGRSKRKAGLEAMRINKNVFCGGDVDHGVDVDDGDSSDDDDYEANRALHGVNEAVGEESSDDGESSDSDDGSAEDGPEDEDDDDRTETESEDDAPAAKKNRKS